MQLGRRAVLAATFLAGAGAVPRWAHPQSPSSPLRLVNGFAVGGASDAVLRTVAVALQRTLERPVLVDNRPGADGQPAARAVAVAAPDGATLLLGSSTSLVAVPAFHQPPPYDPVTDFSPVCGLGRFDMALLVHDALPVGDVPALLRYLERHPEGCAAASSNATAELALRQLLGPRRVVHVPYKGDAPALQDLLAGRVQLMVATGASTSPAMLQGRARAIAATADGSLPLDVDAWLGLFGPAGLPLPVRVMLAAGVRQGLDADLRARLSAQHFQVMLQGPQAFEAYFRRQQAAFVAAARRHGLDMAR